MSARKLWVLVQSLPPDALTMTLDRPQADPDEAASENKLAPVAYLEDIPVAKSMADVGKFVNEVG